jgi:mRNA interferase HigB
MTVVGRRRVEELAREHADAAVELRNWYHVVRKAAWKNLVDVRAVFPDADQVGRLLVFNVRRNTYRLVVKVDYQSRLLMVKDLLTHGEYEKGRWKQ